MNVPKFPDLHMHTTVSDGTDQPSAIISRVREAGIDCFALTDHDDCKGCREVKNALGSDSGLSFLSGIEFTARDEKGKYHILGYGFNTESPVMQKTIRSGQGKRRRKFLEKVNFLHDDLNIRLPDERIDELMLLNNPGSPHLGQLMVEFGYAESINDAIENYIKKKKFKSLDYYLTPQEVIETILAARGIPVLAHPIFGSGSQNIRGEELETRVCRLIEMGLKGLEGFYSKYDRGMRREVLDLAEKYRLYVTAGSDYHGKMKPVHLGDTGFRKDRPAPEGMRRFFYDVI